MSRKSVRCVICGAQGGVSPSSPLDKRIKSGTCNFLPLCHPLTWQIAARPSGEKARESFCGRVTEEEGFVLQEKLVCEEERDGARIRGPRRRMAAGSKYYSCGGASRCTHTGAPTMSRLCGAAWPTDIHRSGRKEREREIRDLESGQAGAGLFFKFSGEREREAPAGSLCRGTHSCASPAE